MLRKYSGDVQWATRTSLRSVGNEQKFPSGKSNACTRCWELKRWPLRHLRDALPGIALFSTSVPLEQNELARTLFPSWEKLFQGFPSLGFLQTRLQENSQHNLVFLRRHAQSNYFLMGNSQFAGMVCCFMRFSFHSSHSSNKEENMNLQLANTCISCHCFDGVIVVRSSHPSLVAFFALRVM